MRKNTHPKNPSPDLYPGLMQRRISTEKIDEILENASANNISIVYFNHDDPPRKDSMSEFINKHRRQNDTAVLLVESNHNTPEWKSTTFRLLNALPRQPNNFMKFYIAGTWYTEFDEPVRSLTYLKAHLANKPCKTPHEEHFQRRLENKKQNLIKSAEQKEKAWCLQRKREKEQKKVQQEAEFVKKFIPAYKRNCWFGTGIAGRFFGNYLPRSAFGYRVFHAPHTLSAQEIENYTFNQVDSGHIHSASIYAYRIAKGSLPSSYQRRIDQKNYNTIFTLARLFGVR